MRKLLLSISLLILLVTACSPQAQPTEEAGSDVEETSTPASADLSPAERAAIEQLARNLGISEEQIELTSSEAVEWPDSCLGITREGIACAEVITAGHRIILEANGKQIEYHTNEDGTSVLPATVALTWSRVGGVAGFCDQLTVYLSGEVVGGTCNRPDMVQKGLSELLTAEEIAILNEWVSSYGTVEIDASDPQGVADGMSVQLQLMGAGSGQIKADQVQQNLLLFAQDLYQQVMAK